VTHTTEAGSHARTTALATESILELFDALGLRNTRPRRLIAEELAAKAASGVDFTVQDFWTELQELDPQIGRATVYRAVDVLVDHGLLDRVPVEGQTHRYRVCGETHHHHVRCSSCQRVVEIDACLPPELFDAVASATDFAIEGHLLELVGRCAPCRSGLV
jgi:Fe2+ or Zn2+ uptake regulation protein